MIFFYTPQLTSAALFGNGDVSPLFTIPGQVLLVHTASIVVTTEHKRKYTILHISGQ